ncbi:MAG: D-alanine--D-alanine ligase [Desulfobacterales bacterium]
MKKLNIALLLGGISSERDVSLKSGNQVYEALDKEKYNVVRYDPKEDLSKLVTDASNIDAALVILHGRYGEDGTVQGLLDLLNIPYQGSGVLGSALAINKLAAKKLYEQAGILIPPYMVFHKGETIDASTCNSKIGFPMVVKPVEGGSSIGMTIVEEKHLLDAAVAKAFEYDHAIVLEKYIKGTEITGGVIGNDDPEPFPLIEIIPGKDHIFFDYEAKYKAGATQEICPARMDPSKTIIAQSLAVKAHKALFCKGYSRTDMILDSYGNIFVLETNTIPGMTPTSLLPQAAEAYGLSFGKLLDRLIELGLEEHKRRRNNP